MITDVCGRCGGSGRYSYNMIDGSTCYGCNGSGKAPAKAIKAAKKMKVVCHTVKVGSGFNVGDGGNASYVGVNDHGIEVYSVKNSRLHCSFRLPINIIEKYFSITK